MISRRFPALNYLPRDVELKKVNGVFKSKNLFKNKQIYVGVEWVDGICSSLPIEMANILAPGRTFSGKDIRVEVEYEKVTVCVTELVKIDESSTNYRYIYQTDKGLISVSGFELARTVFFQNRHLVNAAYAANGLSELAFIDRTCTPPKIIFPKSTTYPVSYLNTKRARAYLAWLLLDNEARNSFSSIYHNFIQNIDSLAFKFIPPNLTGWCFDLSIIKSSGSEYLKVQRVEAVIKNQMAEEFFWVTFEHPKRKKQADSNGKENSKRGKTPDVDIDPDLDIGSIPAFGKRLHTQKGDHFIFNVSGIHGTSLSDGKESAASVSITDGNEKVDHDHAGVGSPEKDGDAQEYDPVINQDDDDFEEADELPQKFLIFEQVVMELGNDKDIKLESIKCGVFPNPTNNRREIFQTNDHQPLRFFVAILEIAQTKIVLLEADTTSLINPKGASTLILGLMDDADTHFKEIIQQFSDKSAQWQHRFIRDRTNFFVPCNHPRKKQKGRFLSEDEYRGMWINNLRKKLNKALEQIR